MGMFIKVRLNKDQKFANGHVSLEKICPVDIFRQEGEQIVVVEDNEDECTLCGLCIDALPKGSVIIERLYEEQARG